MAGVKNYQEEKKWKFAPVANIFDAKNLNPIIIKILSARGINDKEQALKFLNPKYEELADPYNFFDMEKAVEVIKDAVMGKKKITVYGDYDVDGISSTALLVTFLKNLDARVDYYIPSRHTEGYGLNREAILSLAKKGTELLITVDCGSTSTDEVTLAKEKGMKVVITDHHALKFENGKEILPQAEAVINPKREGSRIETELAGVGVAFYLARALQKEFLDKIPLGQEKWLLDLVALGTICDVVPLTHDNRVLASFGLKVMAKSKRAGIKALAQASSFELNSISTYQVGFLLGPRLNAAGRLETAAKAIQLLLTGDMNEATQFAGELSALNKERQEITEQIVSEARELIVKSNPKQKIFLLGKKNWPHGVVGIVASRLADEFSRPILVMEELDDSFKGSARSIKTFDITAALSHCGDYLIHFGGHKFAAGFELKKEHFVALENKLIEISEKEIEIEDMITEIDIDSEIDLSDVTPELINDLNKLEPFGMGNPRPIFAIKNAEIIDTRLVGKPPIHLKMTIKQDDSLISGMAFGYGEELKLNLNDKIDLALYLDENEWNGRKTVEFRVIDLKS